MVLELKVPRGSELGDLVPMAPAFFSYVLSFIYVGIYWNNHHHLMHTVRAVSGGIMWANLHLLFWLSLVPVVTGWVGEHPRAPWPAALYGLMLLNAGLAWLLLQRAIIAKNGAQSTLAQAIGHDTKGSVSAVLYLVAIGAAFVHAWIADALYAAVACIWLVPDRRIEAKLAQE
jgi:uncharacterized membrane protein